MESVTVNVTRPSFPDNIERRVRRDTLLHLLQPRTHWPDIGTHAFLYNASPFQNLVLRTPQIFAHNHGLLRLACYGPREKGGA